MSNDNTAAIAAAALLSQSSTNRVLRDIGERYRSDRKIHTLSDTNDERMAKKEAHIREQTHLAELEYNKTLLNLNQKKIEAEKAGQKDLVQSFERQIKDVRSTGPAESGFETDVVSQNFSNTLEEIATNFSGMQREEQKAQLSRLGELKGLIAESNATEKDFLLRQIDDVNNLAQREYNNRARIAASALERAAEMSEQMMDLGSLYAGFVDHNPVMMAMWRIGADFTRRWRGQKKAQRDSIIRDKENAKKAEELNERKLKETEDDARRNSEISEERGKVLDSEKEFKKLTKKMKPTEDSESSTTMDGLVNESDDGFDVNFLQDMFGGVDEDGDATGFSLSDEDRSALEIDDSTPIDVMMTPSDEQRAENKFQREESERQQQINAENHIESIEFQNKMFDKLSDIEVAILDGNKINKESSENMEKINADGGLLEMLGLGRLAGLLKGPILKALMLFGPAVAGVSALLKTVGMGSAGAALSEKFNNLTGNKPSSGNKIKKVGKLAKLSRFAGGVGLAGAAGFGVGTLINDHVLSDKQKDKIGDGVGFAVDNVLSFFGNDDAQNRLDINKKIKNSNGGLLGITNPNKKVRNLNDKAVFEKQSNGAQLIIKADKIENTQMMDSVNRDFFESPMVYQTESQLNALESKIFELEDIRKNNDSVLLNAPLNPPTPQSVVKSDGNDNSMPQGGRSARNPDSSIQRLTDRMVTYGAG